MTKRTRASRYESVLTPDLLKRFTEEQGAWYESPEEVEEALAWGREKARLLRWVRKQMRGSLTPRQMTQIELYFFHGLTYRQVAQKLGINEATAHRGVQRALRKLKRAAIRQHIRPKFKRTSER
jgi:RNA polymerase sigma factor (sigma-70 family)